MKKLIYWIGLSSAGMLGLVGCNKSKEQSTDLNPKITVGIVYDTGGLGDKSFNDGIAAGVKKAKSEFNLAVLPVQSRSIKDYENNFSSLVEKGANLIVGVGCTQTSALEKIAKQHPNVQFALVDTFVDLPNVRSLVFKEAEGSFLVGYLAALQSKTKKLGFVGSMNIPQIIKFYAGFAAGAKTADANVEILTPKFIGSWSDIVAGKSATDVLYGAGADIVYGAAGRAGLGILKSAKENKKFAIGVDSDQDHLYPGNILTSMMKNVDQVVYSTIKDFVDNKFSGGKKIYGIQEGAIDISSMKYTKNLLSDQTMKQVQTIREELTNNKINVPSTEKELVKYLTTLK